MLSLTIANLKMIARNRHATFWALFFPLLLVVIFGLIDIQDVSSARLAVIDQAQTASSMLLWHELAAVELLELETAPVSVEAGYARIEDDDLDYLVIIPPEYGRPADPAEDLNQPPVTLVYASRSQERNQLVDGLFRSLTHESNLEEQSFNQPYPVAAEVLEVSQSSYFDRVLLGLVALGIMTSSVISMAVKISSYRNLSIFKRMRVTPLPIWKYFASEVAAQLVLAVAQAAIILAVGVWIFGANINGNLAGVLVIVLLGSVVFLNIGFILSAWTSTPAEASGMGNAIILPMMFFAGAFFSTATLPSILPYLAQALPLTPMLDALRLVAIDDKSLWDTWPQLAALGAWVVGTALAAIKVFRFS